MKRLIGFYSLIFISVLSFSQPEILKDILPGNAESNPVEFVVLNGWTYFTAYDDIHGRELWKGDGTGGGTVLVKDIKTGAGSSGPQELTIVNGTLYFSADDGIHGRELWKSDGSIAGTVLVRDINPGSGDANPSGFAALNGWVYFKAEDGFHGPELWKSDGASSATVLVKDIWPGFVGSSPLYLTEVNGHLFFSATDPANDFELWKTDGTAAGTQLVKDILPGSPGPSLPRGLTAFNGMLFFFASNGDISANGRELWKSDGTEAGTQMVKDINPDYANPYLPQLYEYDNHLYFAASDGAHGYELWRTDGSETNTIMVKDINPGSGSSTPSNFIVFKGALFFNAYHDAYESELWKTDGTEEGTLLVKDINPGIGRGNPQHFTNIDGTLFFSANNASYNYELWQSDGTRGGTVLVTDISPVSSLIDNLTNLNGTLLFTGDDGIHGNELWKYDPLPFSITSFTLINAETNHALMTIHDGDQIVLASLPTNKLNIRANPGVGGMKSVVFDLNDREIFRAETSMPYALAGDNNGDYLEWWRPGLGNYYLSAIPYSWYAGQGTPGKSYSVSFTFIEATDAITSFTLINADNDQDLGPLQDGDVLDIASLPTVNLNVRANVNSSKIKSVVFGLNGVSRYQVENILPYALKGDNNGDYRNWTPDIGSYTLTATPYLWYVGTGATGQPLTVNFEVINSGSAKTTAINDDELLDDVLIYPNPNNGSFNLRMKLDLIPLGNITVFNNLGQMVYEDDFLETEKNINLTQSPNGIYWLRLRMNGSSISKMVIIDK